MTNTNVTAKYEEERQRAQEQSQIVYLQSQIDELRRLIKDQTNKYNWALEQVRKNEATVAQVQGLFERHTNEITLVFEGAKRDLATLRKEVAGALLRIDEGLRPIREMQAQIHQLAEARKQDRDMVVPWFARIEEVEQQIRASQSLTREFEDRDRQLATQIDRLREVDGVVAQDLRKLSEDVQAEKLSLRRQAVEAQQLVADLRIEIEDLDARLKRLDEIRQNIELFRDTLPAQIEAIGVQLPDIVADIKRVDRVATERFLMNQERLEDLRHQSDEKFVELRDTDERHLRQTTAWLERLDALGREIEQRFTRSIVRLEEAQQRHILHINEIRQREMRVLEGFSAAFNEQLALSKSDQTRNPLNNSDEQR